MTDLQKIRAAAIRAAEAAAIAGIPKGVLERLEAANAEYAAKGGCHGCGSTVIAVHDGRCRERWRCAIRLTPSMRRERRRRESPRCDVGLDETEGI